MKKIILTSTLALLLSGMVFAISADALVSVQYPSSFSLKLMETAKVVNYQGMEIKLQDIRSISALSYPEQNKKNVEIQVSTEGGCGPNADPRCLGAPAYQNTFTINEGGSVTALALTISVTDISNDRAIFFIDILGDENTVPQPSILPIGPPGIIRKGDPGVITICPYGLTGDNCSICLGNECQPNISETITSPGISGSTPSAILNLSKGELVQSVEQSDSSGASFTYLVKTKKKVRLLFIVPISAEIVYSVNSETRSVAVANRPWWSFLAW